MIRLTCGHSVEMLDDTSVEFAIKSYTREGIRAVDYLTVCRKCYDQYVKDGAVVETLEEQGQWLDNG